MTPDLTKEIDDAIFSIDRSSLPKELRVRIDNHRDNLLSLCRTISIGVAELSHNEQMTGTLFERADNAVLRAKMNGRDRVEISIADTGQIELNVAAEKSECGMVLTPICHMADAASIFRQ